MRAECPAMCIERPGAIAPFTRHILDAIAICRADLGLVVGIKESVVVIAPVAGAVVSAIFGSPLIGGVSDILKLRDSRRFLAVALSALSACDSCPRDRCQWEYQ